MIFVSTLFLVLYAVLYVYIFQNILKGKLQYVLFYSVIFLPVYTNFIANNFAGFESMTLVKILQYSKEGIFFSAFGIFLLSQKSLVLKQWKISLLDFIFLSFIGLAFVFFLLGVGEATLVNRSIYLKNILLIGIFYFFGRNVRLSFGEWNNIFKAVFIIAGIAGLLVIFEKISGTHFHAISGYVDYHSFINGMDLEGTYGLGWTFEAEGGRPRYASFFAHPLELAASMLVVASIGVIYLISVPYKTNKYKYLGLLFCAFICLAMAYSRASFASFFILLGFMAFLLRYYKIIGIAIGISLAIAFYIVFFAASDVLYFVLDTISFQNSSSITHIVDWLNAVNSIMANPMGIGLAMSGNAGGVDKDLMVGGENQYLIYGVQMGVLGMLLYIGMLYYGIRNSWRAFRLSKNRQEAVIPFVAASVKFGMLLPLFTANAEAYIYVSLVSWWFIGYAESLYQKSQKPLIINETASVQI